MITRTIRTALFLSLAIIATPVIATPVLNIQPWKTNNNVPVYFVAAKQLPIIDIRVIFYAGSSHDENHFGLAYLTSQMLNEGAANLSADQIAENFDNVGANYGADTSQDTTIISLRSLTTSSQLNPTIELFTKIITQPTFPEPDLQRVKNQVLTEIADEQQSPNIIAKNAFYNALYDNRPYAHPVIGEPQTITQISRQDLINFHQKYFVAANANLIIVGNLSKSQAEQIANQISNKLPAGQPISTSVQTQPVTKAINQKIAFPGTQSYLQIGCLGITMQDLNFFPLMVGNYILGGGMLVSRLFTQVREQHGLSYSINSQLAPLLDRGPFVISLQTKNQTQAKALQTTTEVLKDFIARGPTASELEAAKKFLIGSFSLRLDSNTKIAAALTTLAINHLPLNYFDTYRERIKSVTTQQIKASFQNLIAKQPLITVTVGS